MTITRTPRLGSGCCALVLAITLTACSVEEQPAALDSAPAPVAEVGPSPDLGSPDSAIPDAAPSPIAIASARIVIDGSLPVQCYYPALVSAEDAPVAPGTFPVVIFGHGYQQVYQDYRYLWEVLVSAGYIVLLADRLGAAWTINIDQYAADLGRILAWVGSAAVDSTSPLFGHLAGPVALLGHSTGGGASVIAAATASQPGQPVPAALGLLAPLGALAGPIYGQGPIEAAAGVAVPTLILDGGKDCICPPKKHSIAIYDGLPPDTVKLRATFSAGDHCGFSDSAGPGQLKCSAAETASCAWSQGETIEGSAQNALAAGLIRWWLDGHLKGDGGALNKLQVALQDPHLVVQSAP